MLQRASRIIDVSGRHSAAAPQDVCLRKFNHPKDAGTPAHILPPAGSLLLARARLTPRCMRATDTYEYLLHQKFFDSSARLWTKIAAGTCANGYAPAYYVFVTYRADGVAPLADKRC